MTHNGTDKKDAAESRSLLNALLAQLYVSPLRIVIVLTCAVMSANIIGMAIFFLFQNLSKIEIFIIDVILVVVLLIPALLFFVFKPLVRHNSERQQAVDGLKENERLLQLIMDFLPVGVWILDRQGTVIRANPECSRIWGEVRMVGVERYPEYKAWWPESGRFLEPHEWGVVSALQGVASTSNQMIDIETFDGKQKTILNSATPIKDENGYIIGAVAVINDITELRQANEQIRKLSQAVEQSPNSIIITDQKGRIEYANPAFTLLTGYEEREIIGRTPDILSRDQASYREYQTIWNAIISGKRWHGEFLNRKKDNSRYWEEVSIAPIASTDGIITHYVAVLEDITRRKQVEAELISSRKRLRALMSHLEKAREEERTRIAREVHDELGQVLASVQMGISLLAKEYQDHQTLTARIASMEEMLQGAIRSVRQIATELRPMILDTLGLGEAIDWQAREFQKKTGIACKPVVILKSNKFDRNISTALFRIFQETLTNIIRHSNATYVSVTLEERKDRLVLVVQDNGRGITPEQLKNGNSLGIMGMRERAYSLGGRIRIVGAPRKGTVLIAHIPVVLPGEV